MSVNVSMSMPSRPTSKKPKLTTHELRQSSRLGFKNCNNNPNLINIGYKNIDILCNSLNILKNTKDPEYPSYEHLLKQDDIMDKLAYIIIRKYNVNKKIDFDVTEVYQILAEYNETIQDKCTGQPKNHCQAPCGFDPNFNEGEGRCYNRTGGSSKRRRMTKAKRTRKHTKRHRRRKN